MIETLIALFGGASVFAALAIIGFCMIDVDDKTTSKREQ